jgi:hypothetical protein
LNDDNDPNGNYAPGTDRNLYLEGYSSQNQYSAVETPMYYDQTQTLTVGTPAPVTVGTGPDTIQLNISGDAYLGSPQFTVTVDGTQIGGTLTADANHSLGESQTFNLLGSFGSGPHTVAVQYTNDLYGGTGQDRNLYVDSIRTNGETLKTLDGIYEPVTHQYTTSGVAPITVGSGQHALVANVSEDSYNAQDGSVSDAQFNVLLDGVQVGGTQTVTAQHSGNDSQVVIVLTDLLGPHTLSFQFTNDASDPTGNGAVGTDRNLYVDEIRDGGGVDVLNDHLYSNGMLTYNVVAPYTNVISSTPDTNLPSGPLTHLDYQQSNPMTAWLSH